MTDVAIIGGGLGGLCAAIQLAKCGHSIILIEKNSYPFHKVCGEYISMESLPFLESLGLDASTFPKIKQLEVSSPSGKSLAVNLPLGGFGVSRYFLDDFLAKKARALGVEILENESVLHISKTDYFTLKTHYKTIAATYVIGAYGKLDLLKTEHNKAKKYIGVKYHIKTNFPVDKIALHNFEDGYCGISAIEDGQYCLCYLSTVQSLNSQANSIEALEKNILQQNPHLQRIFYAAQFIYSKPLTISNFHFKPKPLFQNGIWMLGDAAGLISPLCGNGMSMAMHGSKILVSHLNATLSGNLSLDHAQKNYQKEWKRTFGLRLRVGRAIQAMFGSSFKTNLLISILRPFPFLVRGLVSLTHGKPF